MSDFTEVADTVFSKFLDNLFVVLKGADKESNVLSTEIPTELQEVDPSALSESYSNYVEDNSGSEFPTTTILERLENDYYQRVYQIYHDIRLSSIKLISGSVIGSAYYSKVDFFYKFSTELTLRESFRMKLNIKELIDASDILSEQAPPSEFEEGLLEDFNKITTSFITSNGEAFFILTSQNNMPLFSSLNGKSVLDEREISIPDKFQITKIIPQNFPIPSPNLSFVSPQVSKIPNPTLTPTEIMTNFFHPNWYTLPIPSWLSFESLESFGPTVDGNDSIISNELKNSVWLEQIGLKKIKEIREDYESRVKKQSEPLIIEDIEMEEATKEEKEEVREMATEPAAEVSAESKEETKTNGEAKIEDGTAPSQPHTITDEVALTNGSSKEGADTAKEPDTLDIDLDLLTDWTPGSVIDDDEIEAYENETEQILISKLLIDLNKLRHKRYLKSTPQQIQPPSSQERQTYFKIQRLLVRLVGDLTPSELDLKFSDKLPVLMNSHAGSLPAPTPPVQRQQTSRLPGLTRGPYKKRK